jgi:hypothetical protein
MTVTGGTLTKKVEKMLESLTPVEKARYMSGEWWRLADEFSTGKNVTALEKDLKTIEDRYILSMGAVDFIRYHQERYKLDIREWGARFIHTYLAGLEQQYTLISLLLAEMEDRAMINEMKIPDEVKEDPLWKYEHETSRRLIAVLEERQRSIAKEIKDCLAADFWEIRNLPRPVIELRPDPVYIIGSQ